MTRVEFPLVPRGAAGPGLFEAWRPLGRTVRPGVFPRPRTS